MELEEEYQRALAEYNANTFILENVLTEATKGGVEDEVVVTDSYHKVSLSTLENLKKKFDSFGDYKDAPIYSAYCQTAIEKYEEQRREALYQEGLKCFHEGNYSRSEANLYFVLDYKDAQHYYDIAHKEKVKLEAKQKRQEKREARRESAKKHFIGFLKTVATIFLLPAIGIFYGFKYIGKGIKALALAIGGFFGEHGAGIGKVLLYIIGAPFIAIYYIGYGIVKLVSNEGFLSFLGGVGVVLLYVVIMVLYAAPVLSSVVFAIILFGNVDGISIVSGFGWWCFLWVIYTIGGIIATILLFYWHFSSWQSDESYGAITISCLICLFVVGGASTLVGVNVAPVLRRGPPPSFIEINATSKEGQIIHFSVNNVSDIDVNYIYGDMKIYNGTNQVGSYYVYFQGDYYAGCSRTTYVDFTDATSSFINTSYSDLSVTYKITKMRFFDSYNEHKYNGPVVSLVGSYGVDDDKDNEYKESIYQDAISLYKKGEYALAYKEFKKILSYKESSSYYNMCKTEIESVAKTYALDGDYKKAMELLESAGLDSDSSYSDDDVYKASLYYVCKEANLGRYGPLITYFQLTEFTIPEGATLLEQYTIQNCYCINKVIIPDSVTVIKGSAFLESSVETIVFGTGLTKIEDGAFIRNSNLRILDFSKCTSLQRIEKTAVYEGKVNEIHLPNSVNYLGEKAFYFKGSGASGNIYYSGTKEEWLAITKTNPVYYCYSSEYYYYVDSYKYYVYCSDATATVDCDPYYSSTDTTWNDL